MAPNADAAVADRVVELRRGVALARYDREAEGLSIPQIADRLGRSPATIKAYFYDPTREVKARYGSVPSSCDWSATNARRRGERRPGVGGRDDWPSASVLPGVLDPGRLLVGPYRELIAYGAGWTDPGRQQPVGDSGRHEPRQLDAIIDAELDRALPIPARYPASRKLTARLGAAFVRDSVGLTRTKALGSERVEREPRDALPGGDSALRAAVWEFMRPMLSPGLAALNRDSFVANESPETTVDLDGHRAPFQLDELALDDEPDAEAVVPAVRLPPAPAIRLWAGGPRSASRLPLSPFSRAVDPAREVGPGARRQPRRHATMRHR